MTTLIIGASQAGVQLASSLRDAGDTDHIILIGEENHRPYQRPPLSKGWLKGELTAEDVIFRTRDWYAGRDIELVTGDQIVHIERSSDGGIARTSGGREITFDRLALATGSVARRLTMPGSDLNGIFYLRDADDALTLGPALQAAQNVVVIGGGFIGLEVAAASRATGKNVTVLEVGPRIIGRVVAEATSEFYLDAHRRRGVEVVLQAKPVRITGDAEGDVTGVELEDGTVIPAEVVVIGIGVIPRTELAEQLGLTVDGGIVVDEHALASDGVTVAAGDCAIMPNPYARGSVDTLRIESVNNAIEQAKVAAATLLGQPAPYASVPWFWSDQADVKLQIAGLNHGYDEVVVRGDRDAEKFSVLYYRDGVLIAADCVNNPAEFLHIRQALTRGQTVPAEVAADSSVSIKQSVIDLPAGPVPATGPVDTSPLVARPGSDLDALWGSIVPESRARSNDIHLPLSFAYAERLCDAHPEADALVVRVAILLHDTGWARVDETKIISEGFRGDWRKADIRFQHEEYGCDIAREVLPRLGYSPEFIERVTTIIDGHDTRQESYSIEDSLVRDADRLWRFHTTGIALASGWFDLTPAEYTRRLRSEIVPELKTQAAVDMALAELARSEALLKTEQLA